MGIFHSLHGIMRIEIVSGDITGLLSVISNRNISVNSLSFINEITVQASILRRDFNKIKKLTEHRNDKLILLHREGVYWQFKHFTKRTVLVCGLMILLLLTLLLPGRVLFVQVKGNQTVPSKLIIETADECGISVFASRRKVRSERVKNALLESIPELQWVGVNTTGCVAIISVSEKTASDQREGDPSVVSSIVASRDGVICEFTAIRGNPLCKVGQAVTEGQVLISGYTDCGIRIKATRAEGEVYALTTHNLQAISPVIAQKRGINGNKKTKYSLIIGKKLIKFYKGSGISDVSCVKIYDEVKLTLPGGFQLPISLLRETVTDYPFYTIKQSDEFQWLTKTTIDYLQYGMIAGQILKQNIQTEIQDNLYCLNGHFTCLEMIGQMKEEKIKQR